MGVKLILSSLWRKRLRMFENNVLRRVFRPKIGEVTGGWRKLCEKGLSDLHSSASIIMVMKSRRIRWVGNIICMDI
jgi:hypothetical protein